MADNTISGTTSDVNSLNSSIVNLDQVTKTLQTTLSGVTSSLGKVATEGISKVKTGAADLVDKTKNVVKDFGALGNAANALSNGLFDLSDAFSKLRDVNNANAVSVAKNISNFGMIAGVLSSGSDSLHRYTEAAGSSAEATTKFAESMQGLGAKVSGVAGQVMGLMTNFMKASLQAKGFENSLISAAMAGGNFYDAIGSNIGGFGENLDSVMQQIVKQSETSANVLGLGLADSINRTVELLKILPGEYGKTYSLIDTLGGNATKRTFSSMELLTQVAKGTGNTYKDVLGMARKANEVFGLSTEDAAKRVAVLNSAAQTLKIPFDGLKGLVESIDDSFGMWGTQMEGTVKVLGNISNALKNTGVGFKGQIDIMSRLAGAIHGTSLAQKAFIGITSGIRAPGGAVGAGLKVEKMLQEGKMSDVISMMQDTIEKVTGAGIVSLQEATESPEKQRPFVVQRQMLMGQFGISDTGVANRIMEAMSKVKIGEGVGPEAEAELTKALSAGRDLTERQTEHLALIAANTYEARGILSSMWAYQQARNITGFAPGQLEGLLAEQAAEAKTTPLQKAAVIKSTPDSLNKEIGKATLNSFNRGVDLAATAIDKIVDQNEYLKEQINKNLDSKITNLNQEITKLSKLPATTENKKKIIELKNELLETSDAKNKGFSSIIKNAFGVKDIAKEESIIRKPFTSAIEGRMKETLPTARQLNVSSAQITTKSMELPIERPIGMGLEMPKAPFASPVKFEPIEIRIEVSENGKAVRELVGHIKNRDEAIRNVMGGGLSTDIG